MFRAAVLPLALLFLASVVPSNGQSTEATTTVASEEPAPEPTPDLSGLPVIYYEVRTPFEVNCTLTGKITWEVNDTALEQVPELKDRAVTEVHTSGEGASLKIIGRSTEQDFGKYTCRNDVTSLSFAVKARPHAKLALDTNVVEGQKLKMTCRVIGRPCIGVFWTFTNESAESNGTDVKAVLGDLVELQTSEEGIANATLVIPDSKRWNAGWYTCMPLADDLALARNSTTRLRVKDMYAALWPFLGICAEVLVLCAVILVYEKRRTKPELDDSDTDNHDQKKS